MTMKNIESFQDRLARLQHAEHRANRRDFDFRYGTQRRPPRLTQPAKRRHKYESDFAIMVGVVLGAGLLILIINQ